MQRRRYVGVVLSSEERAALEKLAMIEGRHLSEQVRELIRRETQRRGLWPGAQREKEENDYGSTH